MVQYTVSLLYCQLKFGKKIESFITIQQSPKSCLFPIFSLIFQIEKQEYRLSFRKTAVFKLAFFTLKNH
jgi:hypothetical protein